MAELRIVVEEMVQKAFAAEPPSDNSSLNTGREVMYEGRGDRSMSGELSKEFWKRITGNVLHVMLEELIPRGDAIEPPFVQLQVALRTSTAWVPPCNSEDNMGCEKMEMGPTYFGKR